MRQSLLAGASSFAHLLGRGPRAEENTDKDDDKQRKDESDEDYAKRMEEKDKEKEEAKRAEEEEEDRKKAEEERKKEEAKRAESGDDDDEEGDDDSDGNDMRKKGARSARLRERARCAAIFSDASAGKNPALAAQLAFGTDLPRTQAVNVLRAGGLAVASAPRRPSLDERMAAVKVPVIGAGDAASPTGAQGLAAQIVAAGRKRRGEV